MTPSIDVVLRAATKRLDKYSTPRLEAELLLQHVLNKSRGFLRAFPEQHLSEQQLMNFNNLLARRLAGEPLAYIFGEKEFFSLAIKVTPDVLIPRAETELIVEKTLEIFPAEEPITICELGTGSGAIALALAKQRSAWQVIAVDNSECALKVAAQNAQILQIDNVEFVHSNWLTSVADKKFNVIVSNPPYIGAADPALEKQVIAYEPATALIAADNGYADLKIIAREARQHLLPAGWLLLEHGYRQGETMADYLRALRYQNVATCNDLNGWGRVTLGQINS